MLSLHQKDCCAQPRKPCSKPYNSMTIDTARIEPQMACGNLHSLESENIVWEYLTSNSWKNQSVGIEITCMAQPNCKASLHHFYAFMKQKKFSQLRRREVWIEEWIHRQPSGYESNSAPGQVPYKIFVNFEVLLGTQCPSLMWPCLHQYCW